MKEQGKVIPIFLYPFNATSTQLLQVPEELMENALIDLQIHKQVWQVVEEETRIYLMPFITQKDPSEKNIRTCFLI